MTSISKGSEVTIVPDADADADADTERDDSLSELELVIPRRRRPPRYDASVHHMIADLLQHNLSTQAIATATGVSTATVQRHRRNIEAFGTATPPPCGLTGRPSVMTVAIKEAIQEFIRAQQTQASPQLDEIQLFVRDTFGVSCSTSTISRCLKGMKWTRKTATRVQPGSK